MRKLLPVVFSSLALISFAALAVDPVKPELGAGPHRDRSAQTSGAGTARDGAPEPVKPGDLPKAGGASTGPSKPDTVEQTEDERKATEAKEKMKKKPGYQDQAPSPRASRTFLVM